MTAKPIAQNRRPEKDRCSVAPWARVSAVIEVCAAFALVHVTYRSFKHFTYLGRVEADTGLNFSPGTVMILFTLSVAWLSRKGLAHFGITLRDWRYNLNIALFWGVLFVVAAALVIKIASIHFDPLHPPDLQRSLFATVGQIVNTLLLLLFLLRERKLLRRLPAIVSLLLLAGLVALPVILAWHFARPVPNMLATVAWLFVGAGFGEEIFFRGYVQSRVNEAFGRPIRFLGVDFGWGLFVSATLFGLIHLLNTVDYFGGRYDFAWLWWAPNFAFGLFFGLLREKTGSILPGAIIHGLGDVMAWIPAFF